MLKIIMVAKHSEYNREDVDFSILEFENKNPYVEEDLEINKTVKVKVNRKKTRSYLLINYLGDNALVKICAAREKKNII